MKTYKVVANGIVLFERSTKDEAMELLWNKELINAVARSYGIEGRVSSLAIKED
jgi:hypothetical protein